MFLEHGLEFYQFTSSGRGPMKFFKCWNKWKQTGDRVTAPDRENGHSQGSASLGFIWRKGACKYIWYWEAKHTGRFTGSWKGEKNLACTEKQLVVFSSSDIGKPSPSLNDSCMFPQLLPLQARRFQRQWWERVPCSHSPPAVAHNCLHDKAHPEHPGRQWHFCPFCHESEIMHLLPFSGCSSFLRPSTGSIPRISLTEGDRGAPQFLHLLLLTQSCKASWWLPRACCPSLLTKRSVASLSL